MPVDHRGMEELGNGDSLEKRLAVVDLHDGKMCSTDEMRDRLDL
jgi:hypothetical protein